MKYNTNYNVVKLQMGKSIPDKRTQKTFDNVTNKILQNDSAKNKNISSTTGIRYEQPLKDIHPELDLALAYAQPGNLIAKAFAPSMARGFVEGLKKGDLQQAIVSGLVPESKVTSIVKSVKKPISEAERLGIPKSKRYNLTNDQLMAIDDLLHYKNNARLKTSFVYNPETETFRWTRHNDVKPSEIGGVRALIENGGEATYEGGPVRLTTKLGNFAIWPGKNAAYTANFPVPEGMKWGPGDTNMILNDNAGHEFKFILTSPKTDAIDNNLPKEISNQLSDTIDKDIVKRFYQMNRQMVKPGTYLSGDNGASPLGANAIRILDKTKSFTAALSEILYPQKIANVRRVGLSPDSWSSLVRQGQRPGMRLRWGESFDKWNNSAVKNKHIYDFWKDVQDGKITPEEYKRIFDKWSLKQGGRPLEIIRIPERIIKNMDDNGNIIEQVIPEQVRLKIPHPYIFYEKQGGILKGQNGMLTFEEWYKTIPKEYNDTTNYNLRRAYQLVPFKDLEKWRKNPEKNHLNSVYKNENGDYEFLKLPGHPTLNLELDWYNKADKFKKKYQLDTTSIPWKYVRK